MDEERAVVVLRALAEGVDPNTGECFPVGSPYQHPDTVRALYTALHMLERPKSAAGKRAPNAGKPWEPLEDQALREDFRAGKSTAELARSQGRSLQAIRLRLVHLGLAEPETVADVARARFRGAKAAKADSEAPAEA